MKQRSVKLHGDMTVTHGSVLRFIFLIFFFVHVSQTYFNAFSQFPVMTEVAGMTENQAESEDFTDFGED